MKGFCALLLSSLILLGVIGYATAQAPTVEIFYDLQDLGSGHWQYNYTVKNNSLGEYSYYVDPSHPEWGEYKGNGVVMFEIYFPAGVDLFQDIKTSDARLYSISEKPSAPAGWDPLVTQVKAGTAHPPVDVDVWALNVLAEPGPAILKGESVTGFSVAFDYSGSGTPGDQQFYILGRDTLDPILPGGRTQASAVPETSILLLLAAGMFAVVLQRRIGS